MAYVIGVDVGTTFSAVAIGSRDRVEIFQLGTRMAAVPSVVYLREDGTVAVGEAAERRALTDPSRVAREFKRRLGDPAPIVLGRTPFEAESLTAHLLRWIVGRVASEQGGPPDAVVMTHPASFGPYKMEILEGAVRLADIGDVAFVSEPEAAAIHYSSDERLDPGDLLAVYDLGGGTLDVAMLRVVADGFEITGVPEGMNRFGGIDLDEAVLAHVRDTLGDAFDGLAVRDPAVMTALAALRSACREAKETLSSDTDAVVPVMLPDLHTQVRITRGEFEAMIRPRIDETVAVLERVVASVGAMDEVARVLLVGGASRIPLIAETIRRVTGRPVALDANPKHAVALGAARLGLQQVVGLEGARAVPVSVDDAAAPEPIEAAEERADEAPVEEPAAAAEVGNVPEPEAPPPRPDDGPGAGSTDEELAETPSVGDADAQVHREETEGGVSGSAEEEAPGAPARRRRIPVPWPAALGIAAVIVAAVVIVLVITGGSGDDTAGTTAAAPTTDAGSSAATTRVTTSVGPTTTAGPGGDTAPVPADLTGASLRIFGDVPGSQSMLDEVLRERVNGRYDAGVVFTEDPASPAEILAETDPELLVVGDEQAVVGLAEEGSLVSLEDLGLDVQALEDDFGDRLMGLTVVGGKHYGIPTLVETKSLVWYHRATFEQQGYEVPATWQQLIALSDRMVADGLTPWCLGAASGDASGWPLTDWVEDVVIRTAGAVVYEDWASHAIPFDDQRIADAVETAGEVFFGDGYVFLGAAGAADIDWLDSAGMLLEPTPPCVMHRQGSYLQWLLPSGSMAELGVFPFPTIDGGPGAVIAPRFLVALEDSPAVAAFVAEWASDEFQCALGEAGIGYPTPQAGVGTSCYTADPAMVAHQVIAGAAPAGRLEVDASDQMPQSVQTAFYAGMLDYLREGPASAGPYLAEIEAVWGG